MQVLCLLILTFYITTTHTSIYGNIKKSVLSLLRRDNRDQHTNDIVPKVEPIFNTYVRESDDTEADTRQAKVKAKILRKARDLEEHLNHGQDIPSMRLIDSQLGKEYYHMDPVLNQIRRRNAQREMRARRKYDSSNDASSSIEMKDWKDEFNDHWLMKKFEAINNTDPRGDVVNMAGARPWGIPCGDHNQHDMPWGTCMLASECDSEYRIYRGDSFCGRTQYVCCALQLTNYDLYQGFDISFADTSFSTDSAEKKGRDRGSKENTKRKKDRQKTKRQKDRRKRKRQMKKNIRRIIHEIRKILNRSFRNASHHRKRRTLLLKKYIRDLKKQYRKDRKSVRDIHANDLERIDDALEKRLEQIKDLNKNFLSNSTFRDIVVNGTINKEGARMLAQAYPELKPLLRGHLRRDGRDLEGMETNEQNDYLEYDIEYGAFYY